MQIQINSTEETFFNKKTKWIIYLSLSIIISIIFAIEDFLNLTNPIQAWVELFVLIPVMALSFLFFSWIATYCMQYWRRFLFFQSRFYNDLFWTIIWVLIVAFVLSLSYQPVVKILPINYDSMPNYMDFSWLIWSICLFFASVVMVVEHFWEILINRQQLEIVNHHLRRNEELAKYQALLHQINPHFLFNSLNALSVLVHKNPYDAERFIEELSKIYRYILQLKDVHLVPLKKELDFIESYIFLQKIRYQENLQFSINISPSSNQLFIPPLTLELLIENAIKHNSIGSETPLHIELITDDEYLIVKNPLQPRMETEINSTKIGLNNLLEKYEILGSSAPAFFEENGQFIAKIPLLENEIS